MKRWLFVVGLLSWLVPSTAPCQAGEKTAPRNVVLFVSDDQGQDAGCYGNRVLKTPSLDALAADGTRFQHAFCTTASCSASRSVILSGLFNHANAHYGHQHSYHHFSSHDGVKSLPVLLSKAGYRTARIGKFHVAPETVFQFDRELANAAGGRSPVEMADHCKDFIAQSGDKPFFLYFCTADPHRGGGVVKDSPHRPNAFGNRPEGYPGIKEITYDPKDVRVPSFLPDTPVSRAELAQYYQSISRLDQGLGRLVQILKDAGRYDDTLILFISDHGSAFPGSKTTVYEPGLRAPCVVRNPFLKKRGLVSNAMVSWVDLVPSILDFAGALDKNGAVRADLISPPSQGGVGGVGGVRKKEPYRFHGRSFLPILDQENPKDWDEIYASHTFHEVTMYYPMRVVRTAKHKLIWNIAHPLPYPFASDLWEAPTWQDAYKKGLDALYGKRTIKAYLQRPKFELYDLTSDPDEIRNLADDPKQAQLLTDLQTKLKLFQKRTQDPWVLKWEYE